MKKWFKNWERIETERAITLFSEKGRFSRLGVSITHLSILIILIGGIIGSLYGFKGYVNILEGETIDRILLRSKGRGDSEAASIFPFVAMISRSPITTFREEKRNM